MRLIVFYLILIIHNPTFSQLFGGQILASKQVLPQYPIGSVFCSSGPTAIVDVTNPITGKTWMDRNLGAIQVANSETDDLAYGDLYQWGRGNDGHQCRNSTTTTTLSSLDQPGHSFFIIISQSTPNFDWRNPQNNNLWQGVNGINNPCPFGYRVPTNIEIDNERLSWSIQTSAGAFSSQLKLPLAGSRLNGNGAIFAASTRGYYWTSTAGSSASGFNSGLLYLTTSSVTLTSEARALGQSIRCIKD